MKQARGFIAGVNPSFQQNSYPEATKESPAQSLVKTYGKLGPGAHREMLHLEMFLKKRPI